MTTNRADAEMRAEAQHQTLGKTTKMSILSDYYNWRKYRRTAVELRKLSDNVLNDIGIDRRSIDEYARKVAFH